MKLTFNPGRLIKHADRKRLLCV